MSASRLSLILVSVGDGPSPAESARYAAEPRGDPARGRAEFFDAGPNRVACGRCYRVVGEGGDIGPDLSAIGGKFDRGHLIESLLEPSKQIVEGYRSTVVALRDGRILTGLVRSESAERITLIDPEAKPHDISTVDIEERRSSATSLMPNDVAAKLTRERLADLVVYLESLRPLDGLKLPPGFRSTVVATGITEPPPWPSPTTAASSSANRRARSAS